MTRLAVLADIHGNLPALQAVINDMVQFDVDHVVVAGDSINCGPFSREVMETSAARNWALIRGNNAYYALDYGTPREPKHWSAFTLPTFLRRQLGETWLNVLACLPDTLSLRFQDASSIRVFHGIPANPWVAINPHTPRSEVAEWLADVTKGTVICAHSHIPMERHIDRWHIFNPGSVGIPLDGDCRASYLILEGGHDGWELIQHRRLAYDRASIFEAFKSQKFVEQCGITARLIIEEFRTARLKLYPYIIWKRQHYPDKPDSLTTFETFMALEDHRPYIPPAYHDLDNTLHRD